MKYKGYEAKVEFDDVDDVFHGEVLGLRDVIAFEGTTVNELHEAFRGSVDDYLQFCEQRGESPEKPVSGRFVVRVDPALHRKLANQAAARGLSLNKLITDLLSRNTA
ncbi:MAG: antitoxin HicB [Rhizobiales bacterium NRL2]|jgi:predicted HicB family RNase H-like nuclease|nr:MAG: antitoxin HicB [Rhizobiales bacterium NRL2]